MVPIFVPALRVHIHAYVGVGNHHPLIGVNKLCQDNGFVFAMASGQAMIVCMKTSKRIYADIRFNVPHLNDDDCSGNSSSSLELDAKATRKKGQKLFELVAQKNPKGSKALARAEKALSSQLPVGGEKAAVRGVVQDEVHDPEARGSSDSQRI